MGHTTQVLSSRLIRTNFAGDGSAEASWRGAEQFKVLVADMNEPIWICDCTGLLGFEIGAIAAGPRWLEPFRARGGHHVFVATANSLVKMAATTAGLTGRAHVRCFPTLAAAEEAAKEQVATLPNLRVASR